MAIDKNTLKVLMKPENKDVADLLMRHLPRMQKSALKHEYLSSVANVLINPIKQGRANDGTLHIVGFGDHRRRLPLYLVCEDNGSVRHAFVPHPNDHPDRPYETKMLAFLQADEDKWAKERGVTPRDIAQEIRTKSRDEVNRHGLNSIDPRAFTDIDNSAQQRGIWYDTKFLPEHLEQDDYMSETEMMTRAAINVTQSARMAMPSRGPKPIGAFLTLDKVATKKESRPSRTYRLAGLQFENNEASEEPIIEL